MGYELELIFNPSEPHDRATLVARFLRAGAELHHDPHYEKPLIGTPWNSIWLLDSEQSLREGRYAHCRLPGEREGILWLIRFAERVGCRLYDPQIEAFLTEETIESTLQGRAKFMAVLDKMFGTVRSCDEPPPGADTGG